MYYNLIASAEESTVLSQYVREERAPLSLRYVLNLGGLLWTRRTSRR